MKIQAKENNSFFFIQDIIEREIREAFRIRLSDEGNKENRSSVKKKKY